jgi:GR25 family glycosyltransferase involved in LPS biosynthesis
LIVDKVYLINLEKDKKRLEYVSNLYNKEHLFEIFGKINRYNAINGYEIDIPSEWFTNNTYTKSYHGVHPKGAYGCYLSHYNILNIFLKSEQLSMLVIEDDANFSENFVEKFIRFYNNVPKDWDVILIGHVTCEKEKIYINDYCYKSNGSNCTHGYIINRKGAKAYLEGLEKNKLLPKNYVTFNEPIDCQFNRMHASMNVYIPSEMLVDQNKDDFISNIYNNDQNRDR